MKRRQARLKSLEVAAGVGREGWASEATMLERVVSVALMHSPPALAFARQVFTDYRQAYQPGAGRPEIDRAIGEVWDRLMAGLTEAQRDGVACYLRLYEMTGGKLACFQEDDWVEQTMNLPFAFWWRP